MVSVAREDGKTVSYQYDLAGNRTRVTHPDGYFVEYVYDVLNRVTQVKENGTAYVVGLYTYDPLSRRTGLAYGNGTSVAYGYTASGDMTSLAHAWAASGNGAGTGVAWTNAFTKAHQIKTASLSNTAFQFVPSAFGTTAYSPANALNQYVAVTPPAAAPVSIAYDAAGNLKGDGTWTTPAPRPSSGRSPLKSPMPMAISRAHWPAAPHPMTRPSCAKVERDSGTRTCRILDFRLRGRMAGWRPAY